MFTKRAFVEPSLLRHFKDYQIKGVQFMFERLGFLGINTKRNRLFQDITVDPADSYELAGLMVIYNLGETLCTYKLGTTKLEPPFSD